MWSALTGTKTGSTAIDSYNLQWDRNTDASEWYDLLGDGVVYSYTTALQATITADVLEGKLYKMRIRAHNVHGWSVWSSEYDIKSTGIPD
jgi:hypothetical protein